MSQHERDTWVMFMVLMFVLFAAVVAVVWMKMS